jgi:hypothetical protein
MPDLKISQLPVASATTGAELFPVVQGGVTRQIALNAVRHIGSAVFDASGNLGIGTASPTVKLEVVGSFKASSQVEASVLVAGGGAADRLGIQGLTAGSGTLLNSTNAAANAYAPLTLDGSLTKFNVAGTTRATLDASGNLGIGVTPSAWISTWKAMQGGSAAPFAVASGGDGMYVLNNCYLDNGSVFRYTSNDEASYYQQVNAAHIWYTAASGTAGNAISFTQAMTLDASGNLLVGTAGNAFGSAGRGLIEINGSTNSLLGFKVGDLAKSYIQQSGNDMAIVNQSAGNLTLHTNSTLRWYISSAGHFLANADATYDIGASGSTRPRDYYGSGNGILGGYVRVGAASAGAASTTTIGSTTATTVGAAGGASALPATPLGYIIAHVGTTQVKIPYYTA